jgi:predicted flap endonuclease-1-like 5' DNA nuclease
MTTKVRFRLAPEFVADATEGLLLGEFNNWNPAEAVQLQKTDDGGLTAEIALIEGRTYQYRYLLNDGRWVNDHTGSTAWVEAYGAYVENSIVEVPATIKAAKKAITKKVAVKTEAKVIADDLTKIEGIGKKIATLLKKKGIITYKDLGKSTVKSLKAILDEAGNQYNMHNPATWGKQAKLAAAAKWDELQTLQASLNAGK